MDVHFNRYLSFIISGSPLPFFASSVIKDKSELNERSSACVLFSSCSGHSSKPPNLFPCGLVNIWQASCLFFLVQLVLSSQGSTYRQWPVGLVRPWRVFKHVESTRVKWPWQSELTPTTTSIPPNDCAIINSKLLLIDHNNRHPANDSSFFRLLFNCRVDPPNGDSANLLNWVHCIHLFVEQVQVYSIYYTVL